MTAASENATAAKNGETTGAAPHTEAVERVAALDIARGISLICMVTVHVLDQLCTPDLQYADLGTAMYLPGRLFDAPVFLFIMGAVLAFSRRTSVKDGVLRGLQIFLLGYLLNLTRGTIPTSLGLRWESIAPGQLKPWESPENLFFEVDLLQFAGLSLALLAVLNRLTRRPIYWLVLACLVLLFPRSLVGQMSGSPVGDYFLSLLWGTGDNIHYPLIPWLAYPLFGKVYGHYLAASRNKGTFFLRSGSMGLLLFLACTPALFEDPKIQSEAFEKTLYAFKTTYLGILWHVGLIALLTGLCNWTAERFPRSPLFGKLVFWSRNVTVFYFVQWTLIGWLAIVTGDLGAPEAALFMAGVIYITDTAVKVWDMIVSARKKARRGV
jgi:uncharacterized membrane protein